MTRLNICLKCRFHGKIQEKAIEYKEILGKDYCMKKFFGECIDLTEAVLEHKSFCPPYNCPFALEHLVNNINNNVIITIFIITIF